MRARALGKMLVGSLIATAAARYPHRQAFLCGTTGRSLTFRETNYRSNKLAHGLMNLGLVKGDVAAFLCSNRLEIPEIYFALAKSGIVGVPLNYRLAAAELVELVHAMGAKALLYEERFADRAADIQVHFPGIMHFVQIGGSAPALGLGYEELLGQSSGDEPEVDIDEADPYYFNLTSGTTGLPKSYVLTQFNSATAAPFGLAFDLTRRDVVMTAFPMFGRVGTVWMMVSVVFGIPNVLVNFEPSTVLRLIQSERVTIVNLVPTMGAMLLACDALPNTNLSSLRAIVFAGSMLPEQIREQSAAKLTGDIYEYYGMQETGLLAYSTPEDRRLQPDSVGRAALFAEVRVVGPDGRAMPAGEIGEIIGRSPSAVTAYFQSPTKSEETFREGWVHTGDLGSLDSDGFLFIRGRVKDMIITGGQNVHSAEVEAVLLTFPGVADCAVIGLPHELWGEAVTAIVVPSPNTEIHLDSLQQYCRERLAGFKTPKCIHIQLTALPRTPTGKVQKFLLVEQYGGKKET